MPETYPVAVVNLDGTAYSREMQEYISNIRSEFGPWFNVKTVESYEDAHAMLQNYDILGIIIIPTGFGDNISKGQVGTLQLEVQNVNWDYPKNYIQRLDEAVLTFNEDHHINTDSLSGFEIKVQKSYLIGNDGSDVSGFRGLVVGVVGLYGIIFGLLMGALNIAKEYDDKTILEIINSPVSKSAYLASKQLIGFVFGTVITGIIGTILFLVTGVRFQGGFWGVLLIIVSFILSTWTHATIGALMGWRFKKIMPAIIVSIVLSMLFWFFCGGMGPAKMLGELIFGISRWLPGTYWNEILFSVTYFPSVHYLAPRFGMLVLFAVICTIVSWTIISKRGFAL